MKTRWISLLVLSATAAIGLAPAAQAEVRVSPNYRLAADKAPFRFQDQPGLAVNPNNPNHVVAVNANYLDSDCETSMSTDGGSTWSPPVSLRPPPGQNFRQWCHNTVGTNQTVEFGTGQNVYTAVSAQREASGFLEDAAALLYKSTDGGATWQTGVVAMGGGPGGLDPNTTPGPAWYRPSIGVDPGAANGQDRIHIVARDIRSTQNGGCPSLPGSGCSPITAAVSENGGQSFSNPVRVSPAGANINDFPSKPVVNPDHSVTVAWRVSAPTAPIQVARWTPANGGQWSATPKDATIVVNTGTSVPSHVTPAASSSGTYPRLAVNRTSGKLYMVFTQGPGGPNAPAGGYAPADHWMANALQVWLQTSSDGGQTWAEPKRISEATSFPGARTHQTRHANLSVSPNGRVNVIWQDRRHWYMGPGERDCRHSHVFCHDIRLGDTYYSYSSDGNVNNFVKPIRINDRSHNNDVGVDTRPSGYWWFAPQVVTVGNDQKVLIGWMDSREGNWETDTEDIYLAKVDFNASGAVPQTSVGNASDSISRSVALSKFGYQGGPEGALVGGALDPANPPGCTTCTGGPASRNASSVVIANQTDAAGALAGSVLARANPGPVLLSAASGLTAAVKAEVTRVHPARAFVIGDAGRLSDQVRADVATAAGIPLSSVVRVSGASDAATAAEIAALMDARSAAEKATGTTPAFDAAIIANPNSPDAAAAAGLAAARRLPFLFADANSVPAATQSALDSLDIDKTLVIGDSADVTSAGLPSPTRLGGANQYATSQAVVNESKARGLPTNVVVAADGTKPVEAAALGAAVARVTGIMLLAPAPLYNSVTGQAAAFGLSDVSRFFLAGPPRPGSSGPPPARPTYPGPGPGPGAVAAFAGCPNLTANVIRGTAAANTINGTARGDRIFAGSGNDAVDAQAGNDCVDFGAGNDRGQGGLGNDLMVSGAGTDRVSGSGGNDNMRGNDGNDRLNGGRGNDRATGDGGNDTLLGSFGNDVLLGSGGKDSITGSRGRDRINGGSGNDKISGGSTADRITGGSGKDRITGNSGSDRIAGNSGADRITSLDNSRDRVNCGSGRDTVIADRKDKVSRNCERVLRRR